MSHYFKQEFNIEINKKSNLFKKIYKNLQKLKEFSDYTTGGIFNIDGGRNLTN